MMLSVGAVTLYGKACLPRWGWKGKLASRAGTPAVDEFAVKAVKRVLAELALGDGVKLDCRSAA